MLRGHRVLMLLAVLAVLTGCAGVPEDGFETPPLWRIDKPAGGRVWVLGTIHQLPESQQPGQHFFRRTRLNHLSPELPDSLPWNRGALRKAMRESRSMLLETRDPADPEQLARYLGSDVAPACRPSLPEQQPSYAEFASLAEDYRLPASASAARDGLSASAMLFLLTEMQSRRQAAQRVGVEWWLTRLAEHKRLPVRGLETLPERAAAIRRALASVDCHARSRAVRRYFDAVTRNDPAAGPARSHAIWRSGAMHRIDAELRALHKAEPLLYRALISERNHAWIDPLVREIASPGVVLVAVGMAHLAGPDNLVELLGRRGIRVERVQ